MADRTLIRGATVLTMGRLNHATADVLVEGPVIAEVGRGIRARRAEVIDGTGTIVMPGFVDAHRHVWETLFRNSGHAASETGIDPTGLFGPEDLYAATLAGLLGAIDAGITTVVDWCGAATTGEHLDAALQAHADAGVRSVLVAAAEAWRDGDWGRALAKVVDTEPAPLTILAAGPTEPRAGAADTASVEWETARRRGLRIHVHAGLPSGAGGVAALVQRDLLGADVTLAHCSHLDEPDLDAVQQSGAAVALTPSSDMASGLGPPRIQSLIDRGIRPGLGVGGEGVTPGDLFAQMRAIISHQHATVFDLKLAGKAGLPRLMTTREVIRYATVDGARAGGVDDRTGVLEPGMRADILVLRADTPNVHPVNDPIGAVVWGMDTSNVSWVFVDGRPLKRDGELVADVSRARELAISARERLGGGLVETGGAR